MIVVPEEPACFETMHILNYFQFKLNIEEDNILWPQIKNEMGFHKEDTFPVMLVESSTEQIESVDLQGDQILLHLRNKNLIGDHRTHSAKEKQGLE